MCIPVPMEGNTKVSSVREQKGKRGGRKREWGGGGGRKKGGREGGRQTDRVCHTCSVRTVITWCIAVWCAYGNYLVNSCMVCVL